MADVLEAADQLAALVAGGRAAFDGDWMRQRAAERILEIVGEAPNAMSEEFKAAHPAVPWRHVVNLRHLLAHHYHRVDADQIWSIATDSVPALSEELRSAST
ncbi:MAG TPA: HepT-like ribonuclease domain-containing protein [Acidimicrobiales bacterium]